MNDTKKRLIGYGLGSSVLAGLLFCGFAYAPDADSMTLLGSVEVHLKMAASIPVTDRNGQPDTVRALLPIGKPLSPMAMSSSVPSKS